MRESFLRRARSIHFFSFLNLALIHHLLFLNDFFLSMYPLRFLIIDGLQPDIFDLELDAAELDDIMLPQLVVEFLFTLFETTHYQIHSLCSFCWQCSDLWRVQLG